MKISMTMNRLLCNPVPAETVSKGGIIIPDTSQKRPLQAIVVEVGPGILRDDGTREPVYCKPGDRVLYEAHTGAREYSFRGETFLIMSEMSVLGIIEESAGAQ